MTNQGMHAKSPQKWTRVMSWSVTVGCIGNSPAPSQDRSTINDQISRTDQAAANGKKDAHKKEAFKKRSASHVTTFPLLRSTWYVQFLVLIIRETAGNRQFRPGIEPFTHILIGKSPKRSEQCNEQ